MMKKGFTLIELIMVIVILGVLAAIGIPKYIDLSTSAKLSAAKGAIGTIRAAIAISYANSATLGTPTFPVLDGTLFADGKVPTNPLSPAANTVSLGRPTSPVGGWVYYATTGTVESGDTSYTAM